MGHIRRSSRGSSTRLINLYADGMSVTYQAPQLPAEWRKRLERSKAQIAAGLTVPLLPALGRLCGSAERFEAEMGVSPDEAKPSPLR